MDWAPGGRWLATGSDDGTVRPLDIQVGETVLFGKYAGTELKINGVERTILREEDVLGVVEE